MSLKRIFPLLLIFYVFVNISTLSQDDKNYYFENISIPDGLSNTQIWDIKQDKYGYLWIATQDGLNRYDGFNVKIYKSDPENPYSLPNNQIQAIHVDENQNLFIGSQAGLSIYDRDSNIFTTFLPDSTNLKSVSNQVFRIFEDSKKRIWLGTGSGIFLFDVDKKEFTLKHIKNEDNTIPTSGTVFSIYESSSHEIYAGYLFSGLIKYNESNELFDLIAGDRINRNQLYTNLIFNIYEDKTGKFWLCTNNGLFTYNPNQEVLDKIILFETNDFSNNNSTVTDIYPDENGYLWITTATKGIFRYNLKTNRYYKLNQKSFPIGVNVNDPFFKFYLDDFGVLWVASFNKGLLKLDFQKEPFRLYEKPGGNNSNNNLVILGLLKDDGEEFIWIGTTIGLFKYNLSDKSYKEYKNSNSSSLPSNQINCLSKVDNNGLWIGTSNGLSYYDFLKNTFSNYELIESNKYYTIDHNFIRDITTDDYGNLWIATGNGLVRFDPKTKSKFFLRESDKRTYNYKLLSYIDSLHTAKLYLSSILEVGDYQDLTQEFELGEEKNILIVSVGEGLDQMYDYGMLINSDNQEIFKQKEATNIYNYFGGNAKNRIYAKTLKLKKGTYNLRYISDDSHSYGKWNTVPPNDSTWWGIQVFVIDDSEIEKINSWIYEVEKETLLPGTAISTVKYQKDGNLIIGSDNGISQYFVSKNKLENYNYNNEIPETANTRRINDILIDSTNTIWLATNGGLIKYDQELKSFDILYDKDGLPSNYLQSLEEDNYGNLWIGTLNGISKFDKNIKNPIFINYDVKDGLQSYSFISQASFKSNNGELFFGGVNGFNAFMSGNINKKLPKINVVDIKINNKTTLPTEKDSPLSENVLEIKDLVLNFSQNNISFEFNSIHFSRPEKNMNAYMLEGFDKDGWIYTDRKYASYTNLPEGEYTFRVKGSNGDGIWNKTGTSINITVLPPWWRTIWAYIGFGLVFVGIIFGIDRFQRRRLLKRAREAARIREVEIRAQLAEAESERKSKELEEARHLQLSMLPKELPNLPHLDIAVYMQTATEVGGDYYDFHIGIDGTLTVVVGDATGHGLNAGTMVTSTKSLFNALAPNSNIIETFHEMSRCLKMMHFEKLSMCITMLKIMGNKLLMSSAGMPPVLIYRNESQSVDEFTMKGMPLGTFTDFPYTLKESTVNIGDTILLMSDGFPELFNENKEMFGYKTARKFFEDIGQNSPEVIIDKLKKAGSDWINDNDPDDDVTFVVIKVK